MNVTSALGWILGSSSPVSGAIDVVSVRHEDGSFTCSPFHVKLPVRATIEGRSKTVSLRVNGAPVQVCMRLGSAGEAVFIIKSKSYQQQQQNQQLGREKGMLLPPYSPQSLSQLQLPSNKEENVSVCYAGNNNGNCNIGTASVAEGASVIVQGVADTNMTCGSPDFM
jgi:hypothetical protein